MYVYGDVDGEVLSPATATRLKLLDIVELSTKPAMKLTMLTFLLSPLLYHYYQQYYTTIPL